MVKCKKTENYNMRTLILIILIFTSSITFGQQTQVWIEKLENPKYSMDELKNENLKSKYLEYDFSTLLTP